MKLDLIQCLPYHARVSPKACASRFKVAKLLSRSSARSGGYRQCLDCSVGKAHARGDRDTPTTPVEVKASGTVRPPKPAGPHIKRRRICPCGVTFAPNSPTQRYHTPACTSRSLKTRSKEGVLVYEPITCACGAVYTPKDGRQRYCTVECTSRVRRARHVPPRFAPVLGMANGNSEVGLLVTPTKEWVRS